VYTRSQPAIAGVPLLVVAGVLWGTGGLIGTLLAGATGLPPVAVAGYRLLSAGVLLLGVLVLTGLALPTGAAAWRRTGATALLAAQLQACYFAAIALSSVSLATLVTIGAAPVLVLLVERLRGGPADRRGSVACALAMVGLGLLVGLPGAGVSAAGAGLALASAAGFAALTLLSARPVDGLGATASTGAVFTLGGGLLLAVAASVGGVGFGPTPVSGALLITFAVSTALAYTAYFRGLRTAAASVGAVVALLEPLTGAVLAALLLGERLGTVGLLGAVLLGGAVVLAGTTRR